MDYSKPTLLVVSGPNGAGKSTHIASMLPMLFEGVLPFDRDLTRSRFEEELLQKDLASTTINSQASQLMEEFLASKIDEAIKTNQHFVLETPLSHPDYWQYIDRFERRGYQIQLNYLCLDNIKSCEQRVRQRVKEGGHSVDARTIKGVYEKNLEHINSYWDAFKVICLYDGMLRPSLLAMLEDGKVNMASRDAMKKAWIKNGLPTISNLIATYHKKEKRNTP